MKFLLSTFFSLALCVGGSLFPLPALADIQSEFCVAIGELAQNTMAARQSGAHNSNRS